MQFFTSSLRGVKAPTLTETEQTFITLFTRVASTAVGEDKMKALLQLKDFVKQLGLEEEWNLDSKQIGILVTCLQEDIEDADMLRISLEILLSIVTVKKEQKETVSTVVSNPDTISALLGALRVNSAYVLYYTIRLLTVLLVHAKEKVQASILMFPTGINILVELLGDDRDMIRNEILLLLEELIAGNKEIQKIVAFNQAFDLLLSLAKTEGGIQQGSIVVEDCLRIVLTLLEDNASNQHFFIELGLVSHLPALLVCTSESKKKDITIGLLHLTVRIVVNLVQGMESYSEDTEADQKKKMRMADALGLLIHPLLALISDKDLDSVCQNTCLGLLAPIVYQSQKNKTTLLLEVTETDKNKHIIALLLEKSLSSDDSTERWLCEQVLECFFWSNPEGQLLVTSSFAHSSRVRTAEEIKEVSSMFAEQEAAQQVATIILEPLLNHTNQVTDMVRIIRIIRFIMLKDVDIKNIFLKMPLLPPESDKSAITLFDLCTNKFKQLLKPEKLTKSTPQDIKLLTTYLYLFVEWISEAPAVGVVLFDDSQVFPGVLSLAKGVVNDVHVSGLACFLIVTYLQYPGKDSHTINAQVLINAITVQIKLDVFKQRLTDFSNTPQFIHAQQPSFFHRLNKPILVETSKEEENAFRWLYDLPFTLLFFQLVTKVESMLLSLFTTSSAAAATRQSQTMEQSQIEYKTDTVLQHRVEQLEKENARIPGLLDEIHSLTMENERLLEATSRSQHIANATSILHSNGGSAQEEELKKLRLELTKMKQMEARQRETARVTEDGIRTQLQLAQQSINQLVETVQTKDKLIENLRHEATNLNTDSAVKVLQQQLVELAQEHEDLLVLLVAEEDEKKKIREQLEVLQRGQELP